MRADRIPLIAIGELRAYALADTADNSANRVVYRGVRISNFVDQVRIASRAARAGTTLPRLKDELNRRRLLLFGAHIPPPNCFNNRAHFVTSGRNAAVPPWRSSVTVKRLADFNVNFVVRTPFDELFRIFNGDIAISYSRASFSSHEIIKAVIDPIENHQVGSA